MLYLIDASVLITAHNSYYPLGRVPEFWSWLQHQGTEGRLKIPRENHAEIAGGTDALAQWVCEEGVRGALMLEEQSVPAHVSHVIERGYANDLTDIEIETMGRDPFLIAYGLGDAQRCVVTTEVSKPMKQRANRHIPDVCAGLQVGCRDTFHMINTLDFTTDWATRWD